MAGVAVRYIDEYIDHSPYMLNYSPNVRKIKVSILLFSKSNYIVIFQSV